MNQFAVPNNVPSNKGEITGIRILSMFLDHIIMTCVACIFLIPFFIKMLAGAFTVSHENNFEPQFNMPLFYIGLLGFSLYFCKDCINGRSIAKRILRLQVVNNSTGEVASPLRCFIRNLFCILWPVEVIMVVVSPERRLGDHVAGTKVMRYDPDMVQQSSFNIGKLILPLAISFGLCLLFTWPLQYVAARQPRTLYVATSYNEAASNGLAQLLNDSLGQYLTASVRVYDTVPGKHLKYVSIIFQLRENYLEEDDTRRQLDELAMNQLYSFYPKNSFTGRAQYVYSGTGRYQSSSSAIGRY